jgi:hypothetical protein
MVLFEKKKKKVQCWRPLKAEKSYNRWGRVSVPFCAILKANNKNEKDQKTTLKPLLESTLNLWVRLALGQSIVVKVYRPSMTV